MKNFADKVAVITGGAGGLGREFAHVAAGLGMKIVLADVQQDALDRARSELEGQGAQMTFDAVRDGQFYIYSHPGALGNVAERMEAIVHQRNPGDPYAATPHVREMLKSQL